MEQYKWGAEPQFRTVAFFHRRVRELVAKRVAASGKTWEEAVWDPELELTTADFAAVEQELLDTGLRFEATAEISRRESPDKYKDIDTDTANVELEMDAEGRALAGGGDNVFSVANDVIGTARFISSVETVMEMLVDGVPDNTIAIIDDSGGTLTAPILEDFLAVICKGGSVRSHLGILTREYQIPCLMAATVNGIAEGDRVQVEYSSPAKTPYEDDGAAGARIWKLS